MENHSQYRYTFVVNGHDVVGNRNARNERAVPGDTMNVYYDSRNPSDNLLDEDFSKAAFTSRGHAEGIFAMTCIAEMVLAIGIASTKRRSAAKLNHLSS